MRWDEMQGNVLRTGALVGGKHDANLCSKLAVRPILGKTRVNTRKHA